ncbi:MAG: D-galactonate dehydratase family protein, partial [Burkholderiaceae bacterium]
DHINPCLVGRDAHQIEDIWQYLYRGAYWRRGPVTMSAIGAVDTALWDIKAKAANMPLYQLLGGRSRSRVLVYAHANGSDIAATVEEVLRHQEMGFEAIRAQSGVPGLDTVYGVAKGQKLYEPADGSLPAEHDWNTEKYLVHTPKLFDAVRSAVGPDVHLLHDAHHRLTPIEAARLGRDLEPHRLFWLEDATPAENQESFRLIRHATLTPLAVGEVFNTIWDCKQLIEEQLIDYIRTSVTHAGGVTGLRRIADFASLYQVRTGCHGATDLSPICMGAALHVDTWVPNFGIQEYMRHSEVTLDVFPHDYRFESGYMVCGESAGHGVSIDEKLAAKYPYQPAYLPINRQKHDGAMWNW